MICKQILLHPVVIAERSGNWFDTLPGLPVYIFALGINIKTFVRGAISGPQTIIAKLRVIKPRTEHHLDIKIKIPLPVSWRACIGKMTLYRFLCSFHLIAAELQYVSSVQGRNCLCLTCRMGFSDVKNILILIASILWDSHSNEGGECQHCRSHYKHWRCKWSICWLGWKVEVVRYVSEVWNLLPKCWCKKR